MVSNLQVENISYRFRANGFGLSEVSLNIAPGSKHVFMGANGSGKTTLFLLLNGTLRPQKGTIRIGEETAQYSSSFLRRWRSHVGLVLQDHSAQLIGGSVAEDVALGPKNLGLSKEETTARVDDALAALGIASLRNCSIHELSFGQKKRVAIAGVLAMKPSVLLLDEPTAGLDARGTCDLMRTLDRLHHQNIALVLSTHDSELAYSWANQVTILEHGKIVVSAIPEDAFREIHQLGMDCVAIPHLVSPAQRE